MGERRTSTTLMIVSGAASGAGLIALPFVAASGSPHTKASDAQVAGLVACAGVFTLGMIGFLVGLALAPNDKDAIGVVNTWNDRHIEEPLEWVVAPQSVYIPAPTYK